MARLYFLFAALYLLQGVTEVPFVLNVYLQQNLGFEPSQVGQILFLSGLWFIVIKPLIGFIADSWGGFSKRWMLVAGLILSSIGWFVITKAQTAAMMTFGVSLKVIAVALLDVIVDGMIVIASNRKNRSFIQSLVYAARFGGGMLCAWSAGNMIAGGVLTFIQFYYIFSALSLMTLIPVLIYRGEKVSEGFTDQSESRVEKDELSMRERFGQLKNPAFGWLLLLMLLFSLGADTATYYDPILEQRFSLAFLGNITTWYYVGIVGGILLFPLLKARVGMKSLFVISLLGWSVVEISSFGVMQWNGAIVYCAGGIFNAFTSLAVLTVAAAMCKISGIETFAFAFAVSVKNLFDQSNVLVGGYLMDSVGLTTLFIVSSLCGLLPLLVIRKVDFSDI